MASVVTLKVTSTQVLTTGYNFFLIDAANGSMTLTLPNIIGEGLNFFFKRFDTSANTNTVTIQGFNGSQTIDGAASFEVLNNQAGRVIAVEDVWYSGQTNIPFPTSGNYISAYDTSTQSIDVANTFQTLTFTNRTLNGWTYSSGTFTCAQTGLYNIKYDATATIALLTGTASARITKNGTEVAGSQDFTNVTTAITGKMSRSVDSLFTSGDTLVFQVTGSSTSVAIDTGGSGTTPVSASMVVTRLA